MEVQSYAQFTLAKPTRLNGRVASASAVWTHPSAVMTQFTTTRRHRIVLALLTEQLELETGPRQPTHTFALPTRLNSTQLDKF